METSRTIEERNIAASPVNGIGHYQKHGLSEGLRQLARSVDFFILLFTLFATGKLRFLKHLRNYVLVELGPGPTRLASCKRALFRDVFFVDQSDFGVPDRNLLIWNLEDCTDAVRLRELLSTDPVSSPVFFFADHCLEHISESSVLSFLRSIRENHLVACFRVPNILSPHGQRNFAADATHRTPFSESQRQTLRGWGFSVTPWFRWYRFTRCLQFILKPSGRMNVAEEVILSIDSIETPLV